MKFRNATLSLMVLGLLAGGATAAYAVGDESAPSETAEKFDAAAEYRKGVAAIESGSFSTAEDIFTKVVEATPNDTNALYFLGVAREGRSDLPGASQSFEAALKADPENVRARQELGVIQARLGQTDKAKATLEALKQAAEACAGSCAKASDLKAGVAKVQGALGGGTARLDAQEKLLFASAEAGDTAYLSAVALINEHRYEAALDALQQAERAFGAHPDVLTYLGFVNRKLGRFDAAEAYYTKALALAPDHRGATEYYGELKVVRGDLPAARALLARLETQCAFGCAEADELRRWIDGERSGS